MYTVRFYVKPHLAAYMYHRYAKNVVAGAIQLPPTSVLYHKLHALVTRQPSGGYHREEGNLTIALPYPTDGKSPVIFNYLSGPAIESLTAAIDLQMHMELYESMRHDKFKKGVMYQTSAYHFQTRYEMWDITSEA
ncbi:hypothetical protein, partial [Bacteroides sp.]